MPEELAPPVVNPTANRTLGLKTDAIITRGGFTQAVKGPILDLLKALFGQLLGGLCPTPTPAALHARLTSTNAWDERPASLDDRRQRNQLRRSTGGRFHPDSEEYVLEAVWEEKRNMTEEDCAAIIAEHGK